MESKPSYRDSPSEKARSSYNNDNKAEAKSAGRGGAAASKKASGGYHEAAPAKRSTDEDLDVAEEKLRILEIQQELEAEEEFERLKNQPAVVEPKVARTLFAKNFVRGFHM
jgi:hypothetical protein